ncbi:hypothetical protein [Longirhabdus pacifica]|uniref:hypothetical protein n=1 Tax=Longirhabdus pacifica TaxID=2305227 RepID=UPI001008E7C6|nr:hypothetical protein [Longirhabdus pacifica]
MKKLFSIVLILALSLGASFASFAAEGAAPQMNVTEAVSENVVKEVNMPAIILRANGDVEFDEAWALPFEYIPAAIGMADQFIPAIKRDTLELDFGKALDIVQADSTLGLIGTLNQTINQKSADVQVMSSKLVSLFSQVLSVSLTSDQIASYEEIMKQTFMNLSESNTNYYIWKSSSASNVTYQYNLFFAVEKAKNLLMAMPVGMTVSANTSKKEFLGITTSSKHNYSVQVKAIRVIKLVQ